MPANQNVTQLTQQSGSAATTSLFYAVTGGTTDTGLPLSVLVNNLGLTGTPTVPTAAPGTNTTQIASTAYVVASFAPLASPTFTGTVTVPTPSVGDNTTKAASTAYVNTIFAAPPAIGNTTAAAGNFTTLGTSGLATLSSVSTAAATITGGTINSTSIGGTTPSSGSFTTLSATGNFTPAQTNGIVGTTTNNNANAGSVGEYITATGSGVSLTTATPANITSISLTAGDWDVYGNVQFSPAGSTVIQFSGTSVSTTSATIAAAPFASSIQITFAAGAGLTLIAPTTRLSLASTTTVYLVAQCNFTTSTLTATAYIAARRRR